MGRLTVTVLQGNNLSPKDPNGKSDPFVKVNVGEQLHKTKIVKGTLSPVWNEAFDFTVNNAEEEVLGFQIYDWDVFTRSDRMGFGVITLGDLVQGVPLIKTVKVVGGKGDIAFKLLAHDFNYRPNSNSSGTSDSTSTGKNIIGTITPAFANPTHMTPECIKQAKDVFAKFDVDKSGTLSASELSTVLTHASAQRGKPLRPSILKTMVSMYMDKGDSDNDGKLDLDEFLVLYEHLFTQ